MEGERGDFGVAATDGGRGAIVSTGEAVRSAKGSLSKKLVSAIDAEAVETDKTSILEDSRSS